MSVVEMVSKETATTVGDGKPKRKYTRRAPVTQPIKKATPARKNTSHAGHDHPATKVARDKCRRAAAAAAVDPFDSVRDTMPDGISGSFPEVPYKLQAEQLRDALAGTQRELNEIRRSFEDANSIVQDQRDVITQLENSARFSERKEVEANKRAERAEKHVTTLLDFLAVAVTFEQTIVPSKGH